MTIIDQVHQALAETELRDGLFGKECFGDPAWSILLLLFLARLEERRVSTSDLCIQADVFPQNTLRWIGALRSRDQLSTDPDIADRSGMYVELTAEAAERMKTYFSAVAEIAVFSAELPDQGGTVK